MTIHVNGKPTEIPDGLSVAVLLERLQFRSDRVAVERNLEIVPRDQWEAIALQPGDRIEIVHFVGGG